MRYSYGRAQGSGLTSAGLRGEPGYVFSLKWERCVWRNYKASLDGYRSALRRITKISEDHQRIRLVSRSTGHREAFVFRRYEVVVLEHVYSTLSSLGDSVCSGRRSIQLQVTAYSLTITINTDVHLPCWLFSELSRFGYCSDMSFLFVSSSG